MAELNGIKNLYPFSKKDHIHFRWDKRFRFIYISFHIYFIIRPGPRESWLISRISLGADLPGAGKKLLSHRSRLE